MRWCLLVVLAFLAAPSMAHAALDSSPTTLSFTQDASDGASTPPKTSVVTNNTGSLVTFDLARVSGPSNPDFQVVSNDLIGDCSNRGGLFPGDSCNVRVTFDPSAASSPPSVEHDTVTVNAGSDSVSISLDGTGTFRQLTPSPDIDFGQQSIGAGATAARTATFTNSGTGPVNFSGPPALTGADAGQFQVVSNGCTGDLQPNTSCDVGVTFDPSSFGGKTAQVSVPSNAPPGVHVNLSGTGIQAQLTRAPDTLDFTQDVNAGPSAPQVATITNAGSEAVPISSVEISDRAQFTQLTGAGSDCTPSTTIPVGGTCQVRIAFDPSSKGPHSATVTVNSSAPPISIALNGNATLTALDVPDALDLGVLKVGIGKTALESSKVANIGTEPITLSSIRLRDPESARFLWASGLSGDCAAGRTLAAGESCDLRVLYVPQGDGTKTGTMTVDSTAGVKTLLVTAAGTPGLRIPAFSVRASKVRNRRLTVVVTPVGGTVSNIAVRIRSSSGAVVGSGTLTRATEERGVTVRLRSTLRPGRYVVSAGGRDLFAGIVTAAPRTFSVR
jgi:hypothetical protein